jgi:hypothetical protein
MSNILLLGIGLTLLLLGLFADPIEILKTVGFPVGKLYGDRGQADLTIIRMVGLAIAVALVAFPIMLWKDPEFVRKIATEAQGVISAAAKLPLFTTLFLSVVILLKAELQLTLYLAGYRAYAGDDFAQSWKANEWLLLELDTVW